MKKLCILFLFISLYNPVYSGITGIIPLNMNYNGAVAAGSNIICYTDIGAYNISSDNGKTWELKYLEPRGNIVKIINYNDTLYGMFSNGILFKSTDYGISWQKRKFENISKYGMLQLTVNDKYLFIGDYLKILKLDKDLNFVSSFTRAAIDTCDGLLHNIGAFKDKLVIPTYCDTITQLSILDENFKLINKVEFFDSKTRVLYEYFLYNDTILFNINDKIYRFNEDYSGLIPFFSDSDKVDQSTFNVINNNIYYCENINHPKVNPFYPEITKELRFYEFDYDEKVKKAVGNPFVSHYFISTADTLIGGIFNQYNLYWILCKYGSKFTILNDSIIVMAGRNKTLLLSTDLGNSWDFKSALFGSPIQFSNDSMVYFGNGGSATGIYISSDKGINFMPTLFADTCFLRLFENFTSISFDNTGKGIICGNTGSANWNNIAYSYDFGKNIQYRENKIQFKLNTITNTALRHPCSNILRVGNDYYLAKNVFTDAKFYYSFIYRIDSACNKVDRMIRDTLNNNFLHLLSESPGHFYLINKDLPLFFGEETKLEVRESFDSCKTWKTINSFPTVTGSNIFYEHNADSLFFTSLGDGKVYLYDKARNVFDTLLTIPDKEFENLQVAYVAGKFYIMGDGVYLENTDRSDLTQWAPAEWDQEGPKFFKVVFGDNLLFADMSDSLRPRNNYRIEFEKPVSVHDRQPQNTITGIVYPNPAAETISFESTTSSPVEIFNLMGIKQLEAPYSASIDVSGLAPGMYFIRHGSQRLRFVKE